jgi:hypothetical protein
MMNRKPIYHKETRDMRCVSVANDLWRVQQRIADRGTRKQDCWESLHGAPRSRDEALAHMYAVKPLTE